MAEFFRVVRVRPNGSEVLIRDIPITDDRVQRAEAYADARSRRDTGLHIRVYSSSNETISPGDIVWDSDRNL